LGALDPNKAGKGQMTLS